MDWSWNWTLLMSLIATATTVIVWMNTRLRHPSNQKSVSEVVDAKIPNSTPKSKTKPKSIRISGIPSTTNLEQLQEWLRKLMANSPNPLEVTPKLSIAQLDSKYSQAILTIKDDLRLFDADIIEGPSGHEYDIDSHFHGITVLWQGTNNATNEIDADIILVHGLGGHAIGSWKSSSTHKFWPLDFLPADVEHSRIMTYGHNTTLDMQGRKDHHGKKTIRSLAITMLEEISAIRKDKASRQRPIILLGHSLGGIIIKQAIVEASKSADHKSWFDIFNSCQSLIFVGVPNRGMSYEELRRMVEGGQSEQLVSDLLVDADNDPKALLDNLNQDFVDCIQNRKDFDVLCYCETQVTKSRSHDGENHRAPLIVNKSSASYTGLITKSYNVLDLEGDHRSLVKFSNRSEIGYRSLSGRISAFVNRATETRIRNENRLLEERDMLTAEDDSCIQTFAFPQMNHRRLDANLLLYPGTCEWILKHEIFQRWQVQDTGLLWVKGKPGSGKSTLMSFLYQHFDKAQKASPDLRLEFFFTRRGVELQRGVKGMLRSLLYQLYTAVPSARETVLTTFRNKNLLGSFGEAWFWHVRELQDLLYRALSATKTSRNIVVFIDALDEAGNETARELAKYFHQLNDRLVQSNNGLRIRFCISCRHYPIVSVNPSLEISVENYNNADISRYVHERLRSAIKEEDFSERLDDIEELESEIVNKSCGIFQWARVTLRMLIGRLYDGEPYSGIQKMLKELPEELHEVYSHILKDTIEPRNRQRALLLIQWVYFAEEPLSLTELRFALAVDDAFVDPARVAAKDSRGFVMSDVLMQKQLASLSGGLAELYYHESRITVQFIHQSVKDFLLADGLATLITIQNPKLRLHGFPNIEDLPERAVLGMTHHRLARSCVNYLRLQEVFQADWSHRSTQYWSDELFQRLQEQLPFLNYAMNFWFRHAQKAESYGFLQEYLTEEFGYTNDPAFKAWTDILQIQNPPRNLFPEDSTLLHVASSSNLRSVAQILLDNGADINEQDAEDRRPLHLAAQWGYNELVAMFLERGADINARTNRKSTAFMFAVTNGFEEIALKLLSSGAGGLDSALYKAALTGPKVLAEFLLNKGANVNARGDDYCNALQAAALAGNKAIVQLLFERGAEFNPQEGEYGDALQAAVFRSYTPTVQLLLEKWADSNAQGGGHGSALQAAVAFKGYEPIMQLLIRRGANYNEQDGEDGTEEQLYQSNEAIVQLLLERGANINAQGDKYGSMLQAAATGSNEATLRLLLDAGADVNAQGGEYGNALLAALHQGHSGNVHLLLERGADANAGGSEYGIPLYVAAAKANETAIKLLLEKGANVNAQGGEYGNALQAAATGSNEATLRLLLDSGADVNAPGGEYGNALQAAAARSDSDSIVHLLLDAGADINARGGYYGNALQAAAAQDNEATIYLLLERGSEVNAQGGQYGTALQAAADSSNEAIIQLLLERGANINAQGGRYGNALQAAAGSYEYKKAIVKLLLERGADVNAQGGEYGSALQAAAANAKSDNDIIVHLLLDAGADVNAQGGYFGNALQAAAFNYNEVILMLLLEREANVNTQSGRYGSALQAAATRNGNDTILHLLLDAGADINAQGGYYGNALQAAAYEGHKPIVKLLLERGAEVDVRGGEYGSALQAAEFAGHKAIVKLLLESQRATGSSNSV